METEKDKNYYWQCLNCGRAHCSDKTVRHQMDHCPCGQSAIDAEEWYIRGMGPTKTITKEEFEVVSKEQNNDNA